MIKQNLSQRSLPLRRIIFTAFVALVCLAWTAAPSQAQLKAEVIHWWISGGEAAALQVIIDEFASQGNTLVDTPVKTSYQAKSAAMSRTFAGNPPTVVQWHTGATIRELYKNKLLRDISSLARAEGWEKALPEVVWRYANVDGKLVVVPLTLHGVNWIWASKKVLDQCGLSIPKTWPEFKHALSVIKQNGFIPLALGGQAWQENILFLSVLVAVGGGDFYRETIERHDPKALSGPTMAKVLKEFISLKPFVDIKSPDRSWNQTTKLLINDQAAFQIMGDWAKAEFFQAGKKLNQHFLAALTPGTAPYYIAVSDCFAMIAVKEDQTIKAQKALAQIIMDPEVQRRFNILKGSIPPRLDAPKEGFDAAALLAMEAIKDDNNVLAGINMANTELQASAILDVIHKFWNSPDPDPEKAAQDLAKSLKETDF
jgi:glucose/mannose transport system substrate-binding protein